jgi:hypothetical protein
VTALEAIERLLPEGLEAVKKGAGRAVTQPK